MWLENLLVETAEEYIVVAALRSGAAHRIPSPALCNVKAFLNQWMREYPCNENSDNGQWHRSCKIHSDGVRINVAEVGLHAKYCRYQTERDEEGCEPSQAANVSSITQRSARIFYLHNSSDDRCEAIDSLLGLFQVGECQYEIILIRLDGA